MTLLRDLGEQGLLARLQRFCPVDVVGDDGAILAIAQHQSLVVTTDLLVDGVHFSDRTTQPEDAGWRAAAANLSDLAAMGATPLGITVGLGLKGDVSVRWVERLYEGMTACLQLYNTPIVGGDVVRSPVITLAITAFGQVEPSRAIRRSAAQVGDVIVVTGFHGASRAGLELLLHPLLGKNLSATQRAYLIAQHQRPQPRLDVLPILNSISPPTELPIAGMDSSDGLADAVLQICRASGVGAILEHEQIPIPPALTQCFPQQAMEYALYGGEDFELVLCLPEALAMALVLQLGSGAAMIGKIVSDLGVRLRDTRRNTDQVLTLEPGFKHFQSGE
ncbi:MAG: thiamine-phosphate kinase [Nostocaceae cyanobacterium]|nr:thiamine-phosphate kinase [Nostocaceae cyanobacterium]